MRTHLIRTIIIALSILILIILLLIGFANIQVSTISTSTSNNFEIVEEDSAIYLLDNEYNIKYKVDDKLYKSKYFSRVYSQLSMIRIRYNSHESTMSFFIKIQFIINSLRGIFLALLTSLGLYISRYGWEKSGKFLMALLFSLGGMVMLLELVHENFNIENNFEANRKKCIIYKNVENDVISFICTGQVRGGDVNYNEFIGDIDDKLSSEYDITFDLSDVETKNYQDSYPK